MPTSVQRPLAFFKEDPANLRKGYDPEELRLLAASLVKKQLVPLICRPCGTIIDGHRRHRAALLDGRPTHLDTVIVEGDVTEAQVKEIQLVTALHRADLTPFEVYGGCKSWLSLHAGASAKELAGAIDRKEAYVSKVMSLDRCVEAVREAAAQGRLGLSDWYAISKASETEQGLLLAARLNGASRDELESRGRRARHGDRPRVKTGRLKIELASGVTVTYTAKDSLDLEQAIEAAAESGKLMKKGQEQGLTAKTIQKVSSDRAKAGG